MRTFLLCALGLVAVGAVLAAPWARGACAEPAAPGAAGSPAVSSSGADAERGAGVDAFHPDLRAGATPPEPRRGGRVTVHVSVMPASLCFPIENSTVAGNILNEVHETLLHRDPVTLEWKPSLANARIVEDALVLASGERVFGAIEDRGDAYAVSDRSTLATSAIRSIAKGEVREVQRAVRYTYALFPQRWHPAGDVVDQRLDARDVAFSFSIYANPHVRCDEKRYQFDGIACESNADEGWVRFTYSEPYFRGDQAVAQMAILPSHLYDLSDPDNPDHDPDATPEEQGRYVNENAHNRLWIGLGPYRVVEFTDEWIEAQRFDGYTDVSGAGSGYLDRIRWRRIGDATVYQALIEGELDFSAQLSSEDYFGRATEAPFTDRFYRGYYATGVYGAIAWNLHRKQLADPRVRRAIAHAFDFETFRRTQYKGLATQVTGPVPSYSSAYDGTLEPYAFDPPRAGELLDEAGWYDRDGDGLRDKDGEPLRIEYLSPAGSASSQTLGLKLQEDLGRIGIELVLRELEFAAWRERQKRREFDATPMGWHPPLEPDPEQLWHSAGGAPGVESSNHSGLQDAEVDRLIELIHRETDASARDELWHRLHRRLYELQPFLFLYNVPSRFAMNKQLFGFQALKAEPGYAIRRWYQAAR